MSAAKKPDLNEIVLEEVRLDLSTGYNGQIILHCSGGVIQKKEQRIFEKAAEIAKRRLEERRAG